jgi:hypothetical protein
VLVHLHGVVFRVAGQVERLLVSGVRGVLLQTPNQINAELFFFCRRFEMVLNLITSVDSFF